MGFAAENIGVTAARREITIADHWDDRAAREWLAVHFCSEDCRAGFMGRVFGESPVTKSGAHTTPRKRIQRIVPGGTVNTIVAESKKPVISRTTSRKKVS